MLECGECGQGSPLAFKYLITENHLMKILGCRPIGSKFKMVQWQGFIQDFELGEGGGGTGW